VVGIGLARVFRPVALGVAVVVVSLSVAAVAENYDRGNESREDWRGAAAAITMSAKPGDAVAVLPWFYVTPFRYYFHRPLAVRGTLSEARPPLRTLNTTLRVLTYLHSGHDLWVATAFENVFDPQQTIRRGLARMLVPVAVYHLPGQVVLRRYRIPKAGPRPLGSAFAGG
jgi:hypothetical protein